jgi:antirestriction protein
MTDQTTGQTRSHAESPRVYVACLAAYNAGTLHGCWIDAVQDAEDIHEEVKAMLAESPEQNAEEWAIHDYEGFEGVEIAEYAGFEQVAEIARFIEEHGRLGAEVLKNFGGDLDEARAAFDDYAGEYRSLGDFAEELTGETTEIPKHIAPYVDYDAMGRDMEINGDVFTVETGFEQVHVFWNR